jgi:hypothetical protein
MRTRCVIIQAALLAGATVLCPSPAAGQTPQYRSPAGVVYVSLPDTGGVARAESALAAEPRSVERIIALGLAQSAIRRYREAIATFSRGLALEPENAVLYRWRGHRYLSVRQFDSARADLERGLALDSTIYGIFYHLGIVKYGISRARPTRSRGAFRSRRIPRSGRAPSTGCGCRCRAPAIPPTRRPCSIGMQTRCPWRTRTPSGCVSIAVASGLTRC